MNDYGSLVNASSIAGVIGFPRHAAYTVSKHGKDGILPNDKW
jgi:NADP-dependent 3-hydroxy acid dehydrogenase YdfG